jgi:murein DD-endopeptidase / murein LD-carboxypeptidase
MAMNYRKILRLSAILLLGLNLSCKNKKEQAREVAVNKPQKPASKVTPKGPGGHGTAYKVTSNTLNEKLGLSDKQIRQNKLYSFVEDWYGTPYKYGGCKKSGVDCSCFASILYENVYGKKTGRSAMEIFEQCDMLSLKDSRQGDLVFFKINSKNITHVGVLLKNQLFVHASTSRGVIVNSLQEAYYKKFFFCAGRLQNS